MREADLIARTAAPLTRATIAGDLRRLGLRTGQVVVLHSSLSALGWVSGGAVAVLQAFQDVLTETGTLIVPTHTSHLTDPAGWQRPPVPADWVPTIRASVPAFEPARTPSRWMGAIAETLRTWPGVRRSHHPHVSFAAWGQHAEHVTSDHALAFSMGAGSPLHRAYALGAVTVLLGTRSCTSLHLAEALSGTAARTVAAAAVLRDGERHWVEFPDWDYRTDDFGPIIDAFCADRGIEPALVGNASTLLLDQPALVDRAISWLRQHQRSGDESAPEQLPRFGPLRAVPPAETVRVLTGAVPGTSWTATPVGDDGDYPNGGIWRVAADRRLPSGPASVVVKRTGPHHLGGSRIWRNRAETGDTQWWGREAAFYGSPLATTGWTADVRAARCEVETHDSVADLWLEDVADIPADLETCRRAVAGLAHWQSAHPVADLPWLSTDWIATHVGRHALDNARTLAHPAWPGALERGLDPALREWVATRVTDPAVIVDLLAAFPQALTNHDFHEHNLGRVEEAVVILDWAYVGWGPIGHDVAHLALSLTEGGARPLAPVWDMLATAYCDSLAAAGWPGERDVVLRSMATSNRLRMGWYVDFLLDHADQLPDKTLAGVGQNLLQLIDPTL